MHADEHQEYEYNHPYELTEDFRINTPADQPDATLFDSSPYGDYVAEHDLHVDAFPDSGIVPHHELGEIADPAIRRDYFEHMDDNGFLTTSQETTLPDFAQAQLAHYAAEVMQNPADREHILKSLGDIALSQSDTVVRTTGERESYTDTGGQTVRPPAGAKVEVMNRADYAAYLASPDAHGDKVVHRANLLNNYGHFREAALAPGDELGRGGSSSVRLITVDGKQFALRQSLSKDRRRNIDTHMAVSAIVEKLPEEYKQRSERLVAATYEEGGRTVAEIMPGKELDSLSKEEASAVKPEQVDGLVCTIVAYGNAGLGVDPSKLANFSFDKEKGFGFVDLNTATASGGRVLPVDEALPSLARSIDTLLAKGATPGSAEAYSERADTLRATLPILDAYQQVCEKLPDTVLGRDAKDHIKQLVESHIRRIANFSDPQWVASNLAHEAELRARSLANDDDDVF